MKTKTSPSLLAKCALIAAFAGTASFLIAAESAADTTARGASAPRNSSGVNSPSMPSRDIGTIEIEADRPQAVQERRTITAMNSTEIKDDQVVIPLKRESVNVTKRTVSDGSVRLRKIVKTETVNQPVELRTEMLVLERVPEGSLTRTANMPADFEEGEILLPITREEVVINKSVHTDQVLAHVRVESSRQDVSEKIRSENIEVVDRGNDRVRVIGDITQNSDVTPAVLDKDGNRVAFVR